MNRKFLLAIGVIFSIIILLSSRKSEVSDGEFEENVPTIPSVSSFQIESFVNIATNEDSELENRNNLTNNFSNLVKIKKTENNLSVAIDYPIFPEEIIQPLPKELEPHRQAIQEYRQGCAQSLSETLMMIHWALPGAFERENFGEVKEEDEFEIPQEIIKIGIIYPFVQANQTILEEKRKEFEERLGDLINVYDEWMKTICLPFNLEE